MSDSLEIHANLPLGTTGYVEVGQVGMRFKTKRGDFEALRDINLKVSKGEFVTLIAHSGCGKSTLLNLIAGLTTPTQGHVICNGR